MKTNVMVEKKLVRYARCDNGWKAAGALTYSYRAGSKRGKIFGSVLAAAVRVRNILAKRHQIKCACDSMEYVDFIDEKEFGKPARRKRASVEA